jgi:restriction endonuclease S subunit
MAPVGSTLLLVRGSALHKEIRASLVAAPVCFNQDVKALVPTSRIDPRFLTYCIHANSSRLLRRVSSAGNTAGVLDTQVVQRLEIWLPPLPRQAQVVDYLDDVQAEIEALESLVEKKAYLSKGITQYVMDRRSRLPGFTVPWKKATLSDIASIKTGPFGSALHERDYVPSGVPIITVEHLGARRVVPTNVPKVSEEDAQRLRSYRLLPGDVVFSRVGAIDKSALITNHERNWLFSGRLLRIRFDRAAADPSFLCHQLRTHTFKNAVRTMAVGQTMPSLNTQILGRVEVQLPQLDEQMAIGSMLADCDLELEALEARLDKARALKVGMMQELISRHSSLPAGEPAIT